MHISSIELPCGGSIPELDEPPIQPTRDSQAGTVGDPAAVVPHQAQDRDPIAGGTNDLVVNRLFSAGMALETALGLMGDHSGASKVREAVGELGLAIRDVRNVVFDRYQPDPPFGGQAG